jgi:uncharacterized membrane protein YfcA
MLEPWLYPALTAVAMLTGFVDAIAGGGGLIMVPALIHAGLPPHIVLGTNKAGSMFGTAMAAWRYRKAGLYRIRPNLPLVAVVFAGALLGTLMIQQLDARVLELVVPLLLISVALYTLLSRRMNDTDSHARLGERGYAPVGGAIGFYDGFFGPGTGQFFTATLVGLRGLGLTRATGLTKLLNLPSNFASAIAFAAGGQVLWTLAACLAAGSIAGAWLGAHSATRLGAKLIRPLLITASLGLTAKLVWDWFAG